MQELKSSYPEHSPAPRNSRASSTQPLPDRIITFLRGHPEGVPAPILADEFLKLKHAPVSLATTMIAKIIGSDSRAFTDENGIWHALPEERRGDRLETLPWVAVHCLTDPLCKKLLYCSIWEFTPEPTCLASGWLSDPAVLPFEERELLQSGTDAPFDPAGIPAFLRTAQNLIANRIPVYLTSTQRRLLAVACIGSGVWFPDDRLLMRECLRVLDRPCPRPLTLPALEGAVLGGEQRGESARKQGERFALCVGETLVLLRRAGVETREALDAREREDRSALFEGKAFSCDDILSLPSRPGVYGFKDAAGSYCYIGKANDLKRRLLSYFADTDESPAKLERLRATAHTLVTHPCGSELESLITEYRLIRKFSPPLNSKIDIGERAGTFRPIGDCIVLLPHVDERKGMSVWFREGQKILLKSFEAALPVDSPLAGELQSFFFVPRLESAPTDFPEQEIALRWIKEHGDELSVVPVHRLADGREVYEALRIAWAEFSRREMP